MQPTEQDKTAVAREKTVKEEFRVMIAHDEDMSRWSDVMGGSCASEIEGRLVIAAFRRWHSESRTDQGKYRLVHRIVTEEVLDD